MENIYDEVEIEDMEYDPTLQIYHYPCPCGDRFEIGIADLRDGEEIAVCPSCSLMIKVIFEVVSKNLGLTVWYIMANMTDNIRMISQRIRRLQNEVLQPPLQLEYPRCL
jgi:diphthamide biosynthesis protein 3